MKFLLIAASLALVTAGTRAEARALNDFEAVKAFKESIENDLLDIPGVNGVGVGGCDERTGRESKFAGDFVFCVSVGTETEKAAEEVRRIYPEGRLVNGTYISVRKVGPIVIQPRVSVSN